MTKGKRLIALNLAFLMLMLVLPQFASAGIVGNPQPSFEREESFTVTEAGDYVFVVSGGFREPGGVELPTKDSIKLRVYNSNGAMYTPISIERVYRNSWAFKYTLAPGEYTLVQELDFSTAVSATRGFLALYCWPADAPLDTWPIDVSKSGGDGGAYAQPSVAAQGTIVTLNAAPVYGYVFDRWVVTGVNLGAEATSLQATFAMPAGEVTATAVFTEQRIIYVTTDPSTNAWAHWQNISRQDSWETLSRPGDIIELYHGDSYGYEFERWEVVSGNVSLYWNATSEQWQFVLPGGQEPIEIKAHYVRLPGNPVTISATHGFYWWTYANPPYAEEGTRIDLFADDNRFDWYSGRWCAFTGWEVGSGEVSLQHEGESCWFIMPDEPVVLKAVYALTHSISVTSNNDDWGSVTYGEIWTWDSELQNSILLGLRLYCYAYPGYEFVDCEVLSGDAQIEIVEDGSIVLPPPNSDVVVRANFRVDPYSTAWQRVREVVFELGGVYKTTTDGKFTNKATASDGPGEIAYTSSNTRVATVNRSTGEVTIIGEGVATITASVAEAPDVWTAASGAYTLIVKKDSTGAPPNGGGGGSVIADEKPPLDEEPITETPEQTNPFDDVADGDWFYDDVMYAYWNGLMRGMEASKFSPGTSLNRAMLVTILYRNEGEPDVGDSENPFGDVPEATWYTDAVVWAAENGIVTGYGGNFAPLDSITRQDLALILMRYAEFKDAEVPLSREYQPFNDESKIADYAVDAVIQGYRAGVIGGAAGNNFIPLGNATRAEAAAMLHRLLLLI